MSDDEKLYNLSRRKVLGGLGAVGLASAGAGLGTSAYFNDTESFAGNTISAGQLDLKVDWQQTYYGAYAWEHDLEGGVPINAYPDSNGDGEQSAFGVTYGGPNADAEMGSIASLPGACCDCGDDEYFVQFGDDTYCITPVSREGTSITDFYDLLGVQSQNVDVAREDTSTVFLYEEDDGTLYLVLIHDVKNTNDGGFANVTVWGFDDEPSWVVQDDDDASSADDYSTATGNASADWIWQAQNTDGGAVGPLSEEFSLSVDLGYGADSTNPDEDTNFTQGDDSIGKLALLSGGAGTIGAGTTQHVLVDSPPLSAQALSTLYISSGCSIESGDALPEDVYSAPNRDAAYGGPNSQDHLVELSDVKPGDRGEITFSLHLCDNPGYVWFDALNLTEDGGANPEPERVAEGDDENDANLAENVDVTLWYDADCDNEFDETEVELWRGTLAELFGVGGEAIDGGRRYAVDGDTETSAQDCMQPGGMCVGFAWEVPASVENEIQGDSVAFDLGFYTEQCRHNDRTQTGDTPA